MTEQQGEWFCNISGDIKEVGDMCINNPDPKRKCRDCCHITFMKFKEVENEIN